mmetsp:Transcript_21527/g.29576  ORF Transcript_21527/g.29576 Transcript_21527/m.29576 type:complete len:225 (+) Transcript_21527:2-676(+)
MISQVDNPLDEMGVNQALRLQKKIAAGGPDSHEFLQADILFASPLTRALETCLIATHQLIKEKQKVVYLLPACREKKNFGGVDSKGSEKGEDIIKKAKESIGMFLSVEEASKYVDVPFDLSEVQETWWSRLERIEIFRRRLWDFVSRIRFIPHQNIVVVGHSHFFRALCQFHMNPKFAKTNDLASSLQKKVISNCGVAKVKFDFLQHPEEQMMDIDLLFGTTLV